ncbi:MAG: hypothetical protein A3F67_01080 [Verrucomicrobia bacterium RIFCSPHIGHO2_12_FULL_41_10]|nr:MAG: hypothetical protein A3F67_01080 [Verrucomicrobia bacterium RIFCSPHIGHO2_12_FULL_41_10]
MEEADGSIPTGAAYTPIMAELQAIIAAQVNNSVILIDDIRLFGSALNGRRVPAAGSEHYPLFSEVCALLTANGFTCVVLGDILLAHNVQRPLNFSAVVTACTVSRLYDGANYSDVTILAQEQVIAAAQGEELATLKEAYTNHSMLWRAWRNRSPYFNLWYGLSLQNSGQHRQAAVEFQEVIRLGYEHWRIFWYLAQSYHAVNDQSQTQAALQRVLSINPMFKPAQQLLTLVTRAG